MNRCRTLSRSRARAVAAHSLLLALVASGCALRPDPVAPWRAAFPYADTVRVAEVAPGVRHAYLWLPAGPWAVHVLEVEDVGCPPRIEAVKPGPPVTERGRTSELGAGALAAINADFFMLPEGTPVGPHVHDHRIVVGPGRRPAFGVDAAGRPWAGPVALLGAAAVAGDSAALTQVNRPVPAPADGAGRGDPTPPDPPGLTLFDAWWGATAPVDSAGRTLRLRRVGPGASPPATRGQGVVVEVAGSGEAVPVDRRHVALQAHGAGPTAWLDRRAIGDTVAWEARLVPVDATTPTDGGAGRRPGPVGAPGSPRSLEEAVGGFPLLMAGGDAILEEQEGVSAGFGDGRHPRTAVGWDARSGRSWWVVVDGRQPPYSVGMTLPQLEWLFVRLGATDAINLDGGGSSTMVVGDAVANRPSDREGERPVGNALVLGRSGSWICDRSR